MAREISNICPDFRDRWAFLRLVYEVVEPPLPVPEVDFQRLSQIYGRLGDFLHAPGTPFSVIEDQEWKASLENVVISRYEYLKQFAEGLPKAQVFNETVEWLYHQFINGKISQEQVRLAAKQHRLGL